MIREVGLIFLVSINVVVLIYFVVLNSTYLLTSITAFRSLRRYSRRLKTVNVVQLIRSGAALPPRSRGTPRRGRRRTWGRRGSAR